MKTTGLMGRLGLMVAIGVAALLLGGRAEAYQYQQTPIPVSANLATVQTNVGGSASVTITNAGQSFVTGWVTNNGAAFPFPLGVNEIALNEILYVNLTITGTNNPPALKFGFGFDLSGDPTPPQPVTSPTNFTTIQPLFLYTTLTNTPQPTSYTNVVLAIPVGPYTNNGAAYGKLTAFGFTGASNVTINWMGLGFTQ